MLEARQAYYAKTICETPLYDGAHDIRHYGEIMDERLSVWRELDNSDADAVWILRATVLTAVSLQRDIPARHFGMATTHYRHTSHEIDNHR
nr:hypothetical protein [Prevotella sp.]